MIKKWLYYQGIIYDPDDNNICQEVIIQFESYGSLINPETYILKFINPTLDLMEHIQNLNLIYFESEQAKITIYNQKSRKILVIDEQKFLPKEFRTQKFFTEYSLISNIIQVNNIYTFDLKEEGVDLEIIFESNANHKYDNTTDGYSKELIVLFRSKEPKTIPDWIKIIHEFSMLLSFLIERPIRPIQIFKDKNSKDKYFCTYDEYHSIDRDKIYTHSKPRPLSIDKISCKLLKAIAKYMKDNILKIIIFLYSIFFVYHSYGTIGHKMRVIIQSIVLSMILETFYESKKEDPIIKQIIEEIEQELGKRVKDTQTGVILRCILSYITYKLQEIFGASEVIRNFLLKYLLLDKSEIEILTLIRNFVAHLSRRSFFKLAELILDLENTNTETKSHITIENVYRILYSSEISDTINKIRKNLKVYLLHELGFDSRTVYSLFSYRNIP